MNTLNKVITPMRYAIPRTAYGNNIAGASQGHNRFHRQRSKDAIKSYQAQQRVVAPHPPILRDILIGLCRCQSTNLLDGVCDDVYYSNTNDDDDIYLNDDDCDYPYTNSPLKTESSISSQESEGKPPSISIDPVAAARLNTIDEVEDVRAADDEVRDFDGYTLEATSLTHKSSSGDLQEICHHRSVTAIYADKSREDTAFLFERRSSPIPTQSPFDPSIEFQKNPAESFATIPTASIESRSFDEYDDDHNSELLVRTDSTSLVEEGSNSSGWYDQQQTDIVLHLSTTATDEQHTIFRSISVDTSLEEEAVASKGEMDVSSEEETARSPFLQLIRMYPDHTLCKDDINSTMPTNGYIGD